MPLTFSQKYLIMNRTVCVTAISCLIVGATAGHLATRAWSLKLVQDRAKSIHEQPSPTKTFSRESTSLSPKKERVTGIGGFFFHSKRSAKLHDWYEQHLGIRKAGEKYEDGSWWQDEGPTIFAAESEDTEIGGPEHSWRINFRVRNLDAMVAQLKAAGLSVAVVEEVFPNGRFAYVNDPDGNSIELWEPAGTDWVRPSNQQKNNHVEHAGRGDGDYPSK
jgi:glyoxylase I family protein